MLFGFPRICLVRFTFQGITSASYSQTQPVHLELLDSSSRSLHLGIHNEDSIFCSVPLGYGHLRMFCFQYHSGLYTMQEPSYLCKNALLSIWSRMY